MTTILNITENQNFKACLFDCWRWWSIKDYILGGWACKWLSANWKSVQKLQVKELKEREYLSGVSPFFTTNDWQICFTCSAFFFKTAFTSHGKQPLPSLLRTIFSKESLFGASLEISPGNKVVIGWY